MSPPRVDWSVSRLALPLALLSLASLASLACNQRAPDPPPKATAEPTPSTASPTPTTATPSVVGAVVDELQSAKRDFAKTEGKMLHAAAQMYIATQAACPASVEALAEAKMIPKVSVDPWGASYVIACKDQGALLTITSYGPDGKPATADDVVVASDGS
jgi:hypothetical protein